MAKLTIFKGLPASGKTTKAKELLSAAGKTVRLNKDLMRTMLHYDNFNGKNEKLTQQAIHMLAIDFLKSGVNVISDDTNLNPNVLQQWKDVARACSAKIEYVDLTDVPLETCLARDLMREGKAQVGRDVIVNMAIRNGLYALKGPIVICDLDGTLCNVDHRLHYMKGEKKDWKGFYSEMSGDPINQNVQDALIYAFNEGCCIVYVSGRPDTYKAETLKWLKKHKMDFHATIIMRQGKDSRPDEEVKQDILNTYFRKENVVLVIDDRPKVIRMWRENGLYVCDVGPGKEF